MMDRYRRLSASDDLWSSDWSQLKGHDRDQGLDSKLESETVQVFASNIKAHTQEPNSCAQTVIGCILLV